MNKLAIFDIDGVVVDYEGQLNRVLVREFDRLARCDRKEYSLEKRYSSNQVVLSRALQYTADPNFYYGLRVIEPMAEFVRLTSVDHDILFLSSRPEVSETVTARWLKKNVYHKFVLKCGVSDKMEFITFCDLKPEFVIDDNPAVIKSLSDAGILAICYDQQWNEGVFPRMYFKSDGDAMLWWQPDEESVPFFTSEGEIR